MRELQRKLSAAGFLAPGAAESGTYCAKTHAAVLAFQDSRGLRANGDCDEQTWSALIESSWSLGERILFARSPNIRGDDVAELQTTLNRLGFDCGRVDGIFGPDTAEAVRQFEINTGHEPTGICSPEFVARLRTLASQSGTGPGVAMVREAVALADTVAASTKVVVGHFGPVAHIAHAVARRLGEHFPLTADVDSLAVEQARAANASHADVYIGFDASPDAGCTVFFYEVPTFVSVGGRNLASRLATALANRIPEVPVHTQGIRHPVLRETRMPAVLCSLGPLDVVGLKATAVSLAVSEALEAWCADPLGEN